MSSPGTVDVTSGQTFRLLGGTRTPAFTPANGAGAGYFQNFVPETTDGAPAPEPVPTDPAAAAAEIAAAAESGPVQGAQALSHVLRSNPDPAFQDEVIAASEEAISDISHALTDSSSDLSESVVERTLGAFVDASEAVSEGSAERIARAFAEGVDPYAPLNGIGEMLADRVRDGRGAVFANELVEQLTEINPIAVRAVAFPVADAIRGLESAFTDAAGAAEELLGELNALNADLAAAGATQEELAAQTEAFRASHAEAFAAYETAAANLVTVIPGIAATVDGGGAHTDILERLPQLGQTQAGNQLLADALEQQSHGVQTWLEQVGTFAERLPDDERDAWLEGFEVVTVQAAGTRILEAAGHSSGRRGPTR